MRPTQNPTIERYHALDAIREEMRQDPTVTEKEWNLVGHKLSDMEYHLRVKHGIYI